MPTCSNQSGWNNASALQAFRRQQFAQQQAAIQQWELQNGAQYPGTSAGNCTISQASEFAWWACYDATGRAALQGEVEYWGGKLYDGVLTAAGVSDAWLNCAECYTRFGCA